MKKITTHEIDLPLSVYIDRYLAERVFKSIPRDLHIFNWWKEVLGERIATEIKPIEIEQLLESIKTIKTHKGSFNSSQTVVKYAVALGAIFTKAVKYWKWIENNPVSNIRSQYKQIIRRLPEKPRTSEKVIEFKMRLKKVFEMAQGDESLYKYLIRLGLQKSTFNYMISENGNMSLCKLIYYLDIIGYKISIESSNIIQPLQDNES